MKLIIVTGLSGAGKTQTLRRFEDMGYFCVDNLPCDMLEGFVKLCGKTTPNVENAAIVIDSRERVFKSDFYKTLTSLEGMGVDYTVLYLECRDEVLERRFNETRRSHPMASEVREGIRAERELLGDLRERADHLIDTSTMNPLELATMLEQFYKRDTKSDFLLSLESFGYKRGVPYEADMVFDMRFSKNPFYEVELRNLSGADAAVRDFVLQNEGVREMLDSVEKQLDELIPLFKKQGKNRLLVAFGCTGGRHRSVCAAEEMYRRMKDKYSTTIRHRDASIEAADIKKRLG